MDSIAVTGATGNIGGRVARRLADAGVHQRLVVRDPSRAPQLRGADVVQAEYGDFASAGAALKGVDILLMVSGSETPDRVAQHRSFIDAAVGAGVRHLVYTSFVSAGPDATFTLVRHHWATEEHIRASGLHYTFLRDNLYADFFPFMAGEDGTIRGPAGEGRVAAVAQDDIAEVAAAVLTSPTSHVDAAYDLTGPEALTLHEVAATITAVTGRAITYSPETIEEALASRAKYGAPDWQVEAWISTYTAMAAGEMDVVSDAIPKITGHPATCLAELLSR